MAIPGNLASWPRWVGEGVALRYSRCCTVSEGLLPNRETRVRSRLKVSMQPLDGSGGLVGEDLDEVWSRLVTGRLECVIVELLDAVGNLVVDLCPGKGTVDSGCGLGGVATHEVCSVSQLAAILQDLRSTHCSCRGERHCHRRGRWCEPRSSRTLVSRSVKVLWRCEDPRRIAYSQHQRQ